MIGADSALIGRSSLVLVVPEAVVGALAVSPEAVLARPKPDERALIVEGETEDPQVRGL
ncbi:MAG: hypothetical protein AABZ33_10080 [Chloroflexota bacterium]